MSVRPIHHSVVQEQESFLFSEMSHKLFEFSEKTQVRFLELQNVLNKKLVGFFHDPGPAVFQGIAVIGLAFLVRKSPFLGLSLLMGCVAFDIKLWENPDWDDDGVRRDDDPADCDDNDPERYPGATDVPYDGIDQDCSDSDLTDVDGDGHDALEVDGDDCDDNDSRINPEFLKIIQMKLMIIVMG